MTEIKELVEKYSKDELAKEASIAVLIDNIAELCLVLEAYDDELSESIMIKIRMMKNYANALQIVKAKELKPKS